MALAQAVPLGDVARGIEDTGVIGPQRMRTGGGVCPQGDPSFKRTQREVSKNIFLELRTFFFELRTLFLI